MASSPHAPSVSSPRCRPRSGGHRAEGSAHDGEHCECDDPGQRPDRALPRRRAQALAASPDSNLASGSSTSRRRLRVCACSRSGRASPILFVHGTVGPGAWASLISELRGYRAIVLERPGWGLSSAIDFAGQQYGTLVAEVLRGTLDALGLERAHVVAGSIGNVWALRLAARYPSRVGRIVLMGGGPIVSEVEVPGIIRLLASPAGALIARAFGKPARVRSILRQSGTARASPPAASRTSSSIGARPWAVRPFDRHEREMVRAIVTGRRGSLG